MVFWEKNINLKSKYLVVPTHPASLDKLILSMGDLLLFATPSPQNRGLKSPIEGETHGPGFAEGNIVNGIQIN